MWRYDFLFFVEWYRLLDELWNECRRRKRGGVLSFDVLSFDMNLESESPQEDDENDERDKDRKCFNDVDDGEEEEEEEEEEPLLPK